MFIHTILYSIVKYYRYFMNFLLIVSTMDIRVSFIVTEIYYIHYLFECYIIIPFKYYFILFKNPSLLFKPPYFKIYVNERVTLIAYNPYSIVAGVLYFNGIPTRPANEGLRREFEIKVYEAIDEILNHVENVQELNPDKTITIYRASKRAEDIALRRNSLDSGYTTDHNQEVVTLENARGHEGLSYHYGGYKIIVYSDINDPDIEANSSANFLMRALDSSEILSQNLDAVITIDRYLTTSNPQYHSISTEIMQHAQEAFDAFSSLE